MTFRSEGKFEILKPFSILKRPVHAYSATLVAFTNPQGDMLSGYLSQ